MSSWSEVFGASAVEQAELVREGQAHRRHEAAGCPRRQCKTRAGWARC
jgi:hypothetical protein